MKDYKNKSKDELIQEIEKLKKQVTDFNNEEFEAKEKNLLESEEKFRNLMAQSPIATLILSPDGQIVDLNSAFVKLWGINLESLTEIHGVYDFMKDEQIIKMGLMSEIKKAFLGENVTLPPVEYDVPKTMGSIGHEKFGGNKRWIQARLYPVKNKKGEVIQVILTEEDITSRIQAEEKLHLYKKIIAESKDAIAIIDIEGRYLEQNKAHKTMIGYSDEELKGKTPAIHFGENAYTNVSKELSEKNYYRGELISRTKNGNLDIDLSAFSVSDDKGKLVCYVGVKRNITERKKIEKELLNYQNNLELMVKVRTEEVESINKELTISNKNLEEYNDLFVGREFRIKELRDKVEELKAKL